MVEVKTEVVGRLGRPRYLVLGMDPGIASCGFALLDVSNHEILEMGVRLFDAPLHPKTKQSLAAIRRGFRSTRRNIDRTQDRLKHCLKCFKKYDVVPDDADKEYLHMVKGDKRPLELRVDGLNRMLTNREWGMVLYSLCKRRGYIPHGEGAQDKSSDDGKVLAAISANEKEIAAGEFKTVGEWLASRPASRNHGGNYKMCVKHEQLIEETRILFEAQRSFGSKVASEDFEREYIDICNWERPRDDFDRRTYGLVGSCVYFPQEKRAARCTLTSELVSAYGALGNITIVLGDGGTRRLTAAERNECICVLFTADPNAKTRVVKFGALRKKLDLGSRDYFKGVPADDEKTREVFKPSGWRALYSTLRESNPQLLARLKNDIDLADAVMEAAAYASSASSLDNCLSQLPLDDDEKQALCALPYSSKVLNGYGSRSKKALDLLLACLEEPEVLNLTDAEAACGLDAMRLGGPQLERSEKLIPYEAWVSATGRTNNNPVVIRAMSQMRKVVNAICGKWGVPNEIHVELDRELRLPKRAKEEIAKANRKNEKERERIAIQAADILSRSPDEVSGKQIEKYRLWEEQENSDLYTGERIHVQRLLNDDTYTQIDHILPFSRTGENSRNNKVLVLSESNQQKREQTPYEWMNSGHPGAPSWDEFKLRVQANQHLKHRKKEFLLEQDLESKEVEFLQRNVTDTAYMSREVCAYLSDCLLFPDDGMKVHVVPTTGRATAWLRRRWGLNFGATGEKDRSDDRHHATDACVIAACSRSLVIKTAKVMKGTHWSVTRHMTPEERRDARMEALRESMPWESFANDVRDRRDSVVPTRYVPRKGSGELFEQTVYSYAGEVDSLSRQVIGKSGGKASPKANVFILDDGKSALLVGDMLCLRLWFDPEVKKKGKVVGGWYANPLYKADLPDLRKGTYVPKAVKPRHGRSAWLEIPERMLEQKPVEIYRGDLVEIDGKNGCFVGYNIANGSWTFVDPLTREEIDMPSLASLSSQTNLKVVRRGLLPMD